MRDDFDAGGNRKTLYYDRSDGSSVTSDVRREDHTFDIENQLNDRKVFDWNYTTSQLTQTGGDFTFTYDANGNMVSSATTGSVKVDMQNRIYEAGAWRYRYDVFGRRIEKRNTTSGGFWRRYYYDGVQCIQEYQTEEQNGDPPTTETLVETRVWGPYLVDQLIHRTYDFESLGFDAYVHLDFLGSVVMLTEDAEDATILESYRYFEYGEFGVLDGDGSDIGDTAYAETYLYTGREWDDERGVYYYRARAYHQATGVFLSRDPIERERYESQYTYVNDRPIASIDPSGAQAMDVNSACTPSPDTCEPEPRDLNEFCRRLSRPGETCVPNRARCASIASDCMRELDAMRESCARGIGSAQDRVEKIEGQLDAIGDAITAAMIASNGANEDLSAARRELPPLRPDATSIGVGVAMGAGYRMAARPQVMRFLGSAAVSAATFVGMEYRTAPSRFANFVRSASEHHRARERVAQLQARRESLRDDLRAAKAALMDTISNERRLLEARANDLKAATQGRYRTCCDCYDWHGRPTEGRAHK